MISMYSRNLRCACIRVLILVLAASIADAQTPPNDNAPFRIALGRTFSASSVRTADPAASSESVEAESRITTELQEALSIIRQNYVEGSRVDAGGLTRSSIDGMLRSLDPHSNFFDAIEYSQLLEEQQSEYDGIGTFISGYQRGGRFDTYIASTYPGSPASLAGLRFGDRIVAVNGERVSGESAVSVSDAIRGRLGSTVRLSVERFPTGKIETIELRRVRLPQPTVTDAYMLRPSTGYIALTEGFTFTTAAEVERALRSLRRQGMRSLVLDLRGNTGGILEQAVKVAEKFLPEGSIIVTQSGRSRSDNRVWKSASRAPETMPLVVLVDGETASASEIVAGALQDHDRALIVGEKTFGKGLVQSVMDLPAGAGLALTTARYFTPSGRSIQRDYSVSQYDYYKRRASAAETVRSSPQAETDGRRKVYGGDGITPDEIVDGRHFTQQRLELLDPLFFFSLEIAAGRVKGLEKFSAATLRKAANRPATDWLPGADEIIPAFRDFVRTEKKWTPSADALYGEAAFITSQIRKHLTTAAFGTRNASRLMTETDAQVTKAVELLPMADQLTRATANSLRAANSK